MPEYRDRVFRLAYLDPQGRAAAEDAAQETLVRVWKALPGFDGRAAARHVDLRHHPQHLPDGTAQAQTDRLVRRSRLARGAGRRRQYRDRSGGDPERDNLLRLVETLPANQQQAVRLFYLEDRSYDAVAEALGMPLGTVKNLLFRARKKLMELARPEEVEAA